MVRNKNTQHPSPEKPGKPNQPQKKIERNDASNTETSGASALRQQSEPTANASGSSRRVTNQDDQRQITNGQGTGDVMGEEETEGDGRQAQRLKPFMIVMEAFGALERTLPVMEWI